ncbi:MAG: MBL fold metallo-hydrolase [Thermoprotei archaeon]
MKVIDNIHLIKVDFVNVYLLVHGEGLVLIDAGLPDRGKEVISYIGELGYSPGDLKAIIITHHHYDHTGGLREIIEKTGAKTYAHGAEKDLIKERTGIVVDNELKDGDTIYGLRVIHTPGHTPGHICLLHTDTGSLFVGDLIYEENGELKEIPHKYSMDPMKNREAIKKLLEIEFKHILPSHGKPILNTGKQELERLVKKLETP